MPQIKPIFLNRQREDDFYKLCSEMKRSFLIKHLEFQR